MICPYGMLSQTSFDISPIRIPHISNEGNNSKKSLWLDRFFLGFFLCSAFHSTDGTHGRLILLVSFVLHSFSYMHVWDLTAE
jgi:hypothetical protein